MLGEGAGRHKKVVVLVVVVVLDLAFSNKRDV